MNVRSRFQRNSYFYSYFWKFVKRLNKRPSAISTLETLEKKSQQLKNLSPQASSRSDLYSIAVSFSFLKSIFKAISLEHVIDLSKRICDLTQLGFGNSSCYSPRCLLDTNKEVYGASQQARCVFNGLPWFCGCWLYCIRLISCVLFWACIHFINNLCVTRIEWYRALKVALIVCRTAST